MSEEKDAWHKLAARQEAESRFHDEKYSLGNSYPRHYRLNPTSPIYLRMLDMVGDISGKRVLEYGCGEGWSTRELARRGAMVSAFDISEEAVRRTREALTIAGEEEKCSVAQMGAERLEYKDESFDVAIGFAILHHLDLNVAVPELYRVLKFGGVAFFAEPLGSNPLINLYRRLTPQYRTKDEEPLNLARLAPLLARFGQVEHKNFYITALAAIALAYVPFGPRLYPTINESLMKFDDRLLRLFPGISSLAWYTILSLRK